MAKAKRAPDREAASSAQESTDSLSFEEAIEGLENVVDRLEDGELPLEEALVEFERGVTLSRHCSDRLDAAERRIEVLIEQNGQPEVRSFDPEEEDDESSFEGEG